MASCGLFLVLSGAGLPCPASALESAALGDVHGTQAATMSLEMKVDAMAAMVSNTLATVSATLDNHATCNRARKFYAPADPKKDANGCVGIQDYDLTMSNPANIVLANGAVSANGYIYSSAEAGSYGQTFLARWGLANTTGNIYVEPKPAGFLYLVPSDWSTNLTTVVYGKLCLNGTDAAHCVTSLGGDGGNGIKWGGSFVDLTNNGGGYANAFTGGRSCPPGYSSYAAATGTSGSYIYVLYQCYRGAWNGT